jgi:competence protein ComEA
MEASVVPSSDVFGDRGDDPVDPLAPLRAAAVVPADGWLERARATVDQIRGGGPARWLAVALAVLAAGGVAGAAVVLRSSSSPGHAGASSSLPFARGSGTTVGSGTSSGSGTDQSGSTGSTVPDGSSRPAGTAPGDLVAQAAGAVVHPGVYHLAAGSRVADLVAAAGGLGPDADGDRVNLASPLADGARVYVPRRGEATPPGPVSDGGGSGGAGSAPSTTAPPVDLNTATAEQLDTLPGVGPATAAAIIDYRQRHGPFHSVDDLAQVRGIGDAKLGQLRDLVRV